MAELAPDDEFICFLDPRSAERFDLERPNIRRVVVSQGAAPTEAAAANGYRSPADMLRLTRAVWRESLDVFFSPSVYSYFPLPPGLAAVITVHDAIAERFPALTLPSPRARFFWHLKVSLALWQARLVLTVSDFAARELAQVLGVAPRRIRVAVEAPAPAFRPSETSQQIVTAARRAKIPTGARWFVYVGGFNPHKNLDLLVRAHATIAWERGADAPHLLLVGATDGDVFHSDQARVRRLIEELGTQRLVHWTGFVPDEELRHLHTGALALVLPSACEGFGLPAVEAAACGAPVVATTESPLPVLLEGGGIFIRPGDEAALTAALRVLLGDEAARAAMGQRARLRAAELGWPRGAGAALAALREAAA